MTVTTARILDIRRQLKKTKTYPVTIRVTSNRIPTLFPIGIYLTKEDFKKLSSPRLGEHLSNVRDKVISEEQKAKKIIEELGTFTFQAFRERFYKDSLSRKKMISKNPPKTSLDSKPDSVLESSPLANNFEGRNKKYGKRKNDRIRSNINYQLWGPVAIAFGEYIKLLETQERIGTSECYFTTLMSLLKYRPGLRFEDITIKFLYEYEQWMLNKNNSYTTIGIYLRSLRSIFNIQIIDRLIPAEIYPFGKRKYQIPTGANVKKALELLDIRKIYDYIPDANNGNEGFARDIWLFGYYSNGINPKDIAYLKYKNIDEDFIIIQREKTRFTTRSKPKNILIPINDEMRLIIDRWGNSDRSFENYIFPILTHGISAHRKRELVQGFTGTINDWMKRIAEKVGIKKKVLTMTYRHSYATILKRSGVSSDFIKEQLGHTDLQTTENYLDSFELEIKKKYANNLMAFKDIIITTSTEHF